MAGLNKYLHTVCPINFLKNLFNIFTGHFLCDKICLEELCVSKDLNEALTEGLTGLTRQEEVGITVKELLSYTSAVEQEQKTEML